MNRRDSMAAFISCTCTLLFAIFFVFQIKLSAVFDQRPTSIQVAAERKRWDLNTSSKADPLPPPPHHSPSATISCDRSHYRYDICSINGPAILDPTTSTFFAMGPTIVSTQQPLVEKIRPYPRKWETSIMTGIKVLTLTAGAPSPPCKVQHNIPALVFCAGGYTGNFFHEFSDGFIPLFITVNSIFPPDQDFVLVISKSRDWWVNKYADLLRAFSKHPIVNLDNETTTHCFPSVSVGLVSHGFIAVDPSLLPNSITFKHFRSLLETAYGGGNRRQTPPHRRKVRPRLVLASRNGSTGRVILNQAEIKLIAEEEGFEVIVFEPKPSTRLIEAYDLMNSSHAMVGVHGAALTHMLFLRPGSVFVQIVPIGTEKVSEWCFGQPARELGLEYMEYRIEVDESSLVDRYGKDDLLVKDPRAVQGKWWSREIMDKYLKEQNVRLDQVRFRAYLKKAFVKAQEFMEKEG